MRRTAPSRVADDAAVAGRVVDVGAEHGGGGRAAAVRAHEAARACRASSSGTSPLSTSTSPSKSGELVERHLDGAAGAGHLVLVDDDHARARSSRTAAATRSRSWRTTTTTRCGRERVRGVEHVPDERAAADAVQHLRERRTSCGCPGRRPGRSRRDGVDGVLGHAPPPGLEPGPNSSKGCRAAITPRRTAAPEGGSRPSSLPCERRPGRSAATRGSRGPR